MAQKDLPEHIIQLILYTYLMPPDRVVFNSYYGTNRIFPLIKGVNTLHILSRGSIHNYGMAVDLGIWVDGVGLLDMGTVFDDFSELSHITGRFIIKYWHAQNPTC